MDKNALANKLLKNRGLPPINEKPNGASSVPATSTTSPSPFTATYGEGKLSEAGYYLKSARICLLTWIRDNYREADNVDRNTDSVSELLVMANQLENIRARVDVKASILGK